MMDHSISNDASLPTELYSVFPTTIMNVLHLEEFNMPRASYGQMAALISLDTA
jgi:hypothetical protein